MTKLAGWLNSIVIGIISQVSGRPRAFLSAYELVEGK